MSAKSDANQINFDFLFMDHPLPMWIYDVRSLAFLEVNNAAVKKYGYTRKKFLSMTLEDLWPKEDVSRLIKEVSKKRSSTSQINNRRHKLKSGKIIDVEITSHTLNFTKHKAVLVTAKDITERKLVESKLKLTQFGIDHFQTSVFQIDDEGKIYYANQQACKSLGYTYDELTSMSIIDIDPAFTLTKWKEHRKNIHKKGWGLIETIHRRKDSTEFPVEVSINFFKYAGKKVSFSFAIDITERKLAEEALIETENKFHNVVEEAVDIVFTIDDRGYFTYANPAGIKASGYSFDELSKLKYIDLVEPEFKKVAKVNFLRQYLERKELTHTQYPFRSKSGEIKWLEQNTRLIIENENIKGFFVISRDVTERQKAQEALQESESKLQVIIESTADGILAVGKNGKIIKTNNRFTELWRIPPAIINSSDDDKLLNFVLDQLIDPEQFLIKVRLLYNSSDKDLDVLNFKDGRTFERYSAPLLMGNKVLGRVWSFRDVTERKFAEIALQESEKKFRSVWEKSSDGMRITNEEGIVIMVNDSYCRLVEKPHDEMVGKPMSVIQEEDRQAEILLKHKERFHSRNVPGYTEKKITLWNGNVIYLELSNTFLEISNQQTLLLSVFRDITERKLAEEMLQEKENQMRMIVEGTPQLFFYTQDAQSLVTYISPSIKNITGYSVEEWLNQSHWFITENKLNDLAKERTHAHLRGELTEGPILVEVEHCDNHPILLEVYESPIIQNEKVIGLYGVAHDITERKHSEESLRKSQEDLIKFFDDDLSADYISTPSGQLLNCNKTYLNVFGFKSKEEALAFPIEKIYPAPSSRKTFIELIKKNKKVENYENEYVSIDGRSIYTIENAAAEFNETGELIQIRGYIVDITERKMAEKELQKLSRAVEQSPASVIITNREGNIEYVNNKFSDVTGYSKEEVIGKNPNILKSGYHDKDFYENLWNNLLKGEDWEGEIQNKKKNGELYWESSLISPLVNNEGKITHFVGIKEDITERKRTEEALLLFRKVIDQSDDTIEIVDAETGSFLDCNEKAHRELGYTREEFLSMKVFNIDPVFTEDKFAESLKMIINSGSFLLESIHRRKDGYEFPVEISGKIVSLDRDYVIVITRNITERKRVEKELIKAKEEAESSNRLKDAFIANMSHEIRTPLNGILGLTSIIQDTYGEQINQRDKELFAGIDHSSKRIIRTVDMILNYSRIQTGEFPINPHEIEISLICKNLVREFTSTANKKLLELSFENRCGQITTIFGDEYSITQAISNLIDNAIKYSNKGFINVILYSGNNDEILLDIKDSGIGMSNEFMQHIFEPYQQEHIGYGRAYEGVGLGLSMVNKFLNLNKAKISIESEKGKGTTFTINFGKPLQSSTVKTNDEKIDSIFTRQEIQHKPLVLIVEDDAINRSTIKRFIEDGYRSISTDSSEEAIALLKDNKVDMILMDISIKGNKNGLELTKELKASIEYSHIPVIAITAHAFDRDRQNALQAGCNDYLSKPFSKALLLETIGKF